MPQFLIMSATRPGTFDDLTPAEMQRRIGEYHAWGQALAAEGRLVAAHKLRDGEGRVVRGEGDAGISVADGPFAETKEIVGGFWIIEADDMDHALRAVSTHPHVGTGRLELREIEQLDL